MLPDRVVRTLAFAALAAGALMLTKPVWDTLCSARDSGSGVCAAAASVDLAGALLLLVGFVALYAVQVEASGRLGLLAFVASMAGTGLYAGIKWMRLFVQPWLLERFPELAAAPMPELLRTGMGVSWAVAIGGWVLFAAATFRARVLPRGAAVLLALSALADYVLPAGLGSGIVSGPLAGAAFAWLAVSARRPPHAVPAEVSAEPVAAGA